MMVLFDRDGHITKDGFYLLMENKADELQRLELSEHLSFCDRCLEKYLDCLQEVRLLAPENPLAEGILKKARYKAMAVFHSRFSMVAAAVCIAMVFWTTGVFQWQYGILEKNPAGEIAQKMDAVTRQTENFTIRFSKNYLKICDKIETKGVFGYGKK